MRILYFGNGARGERCLEAIVAHGRDEVVGVVAHPGAPTPSIADLAASLSIPVHRPANVNSREFRSTVARLEPDLAVLSGYNRILRGRLLAIPSQGAINLHGGKLPEYRGAAPINWQILNGESAGGCSIIVVYEGIDTGPILAEERYPIDPDEDARSVLEKTLRIFPPLLIETLDRLRDGTVAPRAQDPTAGAYWTRRTPADSRIDWRTMTARQVHDLVRASVPPYPGAFCLHDDLPLYLLKTRRLSEEIRGVPGRIALRREDGIVVIARDRGLLVERVAVGDVDCEVEVGEALRVGGDLG